MTTQGRWRNVLPPPPFHVNRPLTSLCYLEAEQVPESAAGGSWTGWAVSSLTSKLYRGGSGSGGASEPADKSTPGKETNPGIVVFLQLYLQADFKQNKSSNNKPACIRVRWPTLQALISAFCIKKRLQLVVRVIGSVSYIEGEISKKMTWRETNLLRVSGGEVRVIKGSRV